ncbi:phosphoinositide 3-phosphate phosphatase [Magnaporthiopsis poae ATCC 64411]|uniref:phosphatidylinositol-3,4,5-trisphosphate 3-phosphatase n=1 Tax=Magnaporthiopsis poae (strain ATCC 64411 / 73-15) TaxID=644358 RepID=A0A0C4DNJ8_MAGP6|nr:phosphoinositide 3-phosphate phosphatase [Magnaporthiopsis poae ATCC 64411]
MASILRQIVAGPRARHEETGLDLCYVTSNIIATSGPSQTYPQRAYRNPLDRLVAFLDDQHGDDWAIWEFRGEGTGYPDDAVYGRIRHYPWPDHHPPPFRLVPLIMASMRNWLAGGELGGPGHGVDTPIKTDTRSSEDHPASGEAGKVQDKAKAERLESEEHTSESVEAGTKKGRVVVVHCKAGKGRSGSMACSFLISERGWTPEDALARFTERRMRPKFGAGVTIPSQLRWISYVNRWANHGGKRYTDRAVEIVEVHMWGLRNGVKVSVEHFVDEGRRIKCLSAEINERVIVEGDTPSAGTVAEVVPDLTKLAAAEASSGAGEDADYEAVKDEPRKNDGADAVLIKPNKSSKTASLMRKLSKRTIGSPHRIQSEQEDAPSMSSSAAASTQLLSSVTSATTTPASVSASQSSLSKASGSSEKEPGGMAVIFKPKQPLIVPNSDINIAVERRNKAPASMGLMTMVTAVAHVWFNVFFEGRGPEQGGKADDSGVFQIEWDKMDGIKGSSQKGTRGLDRLAVVWRTVESAPENKAEGEPSSTQDGLLEGNQGGATIHLTRASTEIREPGEGEEVPQMAAADWKGGNKEDPEAEKRLGLRVQDPDSANVSKASSIKSFKMEGVDGKSEGGPVGSGKDKDGDTDSLMGVKTSGPEGDALDDSVISPASSKLTGRKPDGDGAGVEPSVADATAKKGFVVE